MTDLLKHPIHKEIYDLCLEIENLSASEQQTKIVVMASSLQNSADKLTTERNLLRNEINVLIGMLAYWVPEQEPLKRQTDPIVEVHKRFWSEARKKIEFYTGRYNPETGYMELTTPETDKL